METGRTKRVNVEKKNDQLWQERTKQKWQTLFRGLPFMGKKLLSMASFGLSSKILSGLYEVN